jgi:Protein of unknown function (DUF5818)
MHTLAKSSPVLVSRSFLIQGSLALAMYSLMLVAAATFVQPLPDRVDAAVLDASVSVPMSPSLRSPEESASHRSGKTTVLTGTLVKGASDWMLRLPSGAVYRLDESSDAERVKASGFAGKPVSVTGRVEEAGKLIHVDKVADKGTDNRS